MKLNHKQIILAFIVFFTASGLVFADSKQRPNILLISADDLGFDDLSVHGNPIIETPSIDQLAAQSVRFSDFSVSPVCATTRASLLTGRHYYRTGVSGVHGGRDYLNKDETLISDMLKTNGYATGTWGKWHLGKTDGYLPWDRGFDESYYAELYRHKNSIGFFNNNYVEHEQWVSQVVSDYAINFMRKSQAADQPFFAYVSFLAPHEPWLAPKEYVAPYLAKGERPAIANLYGMISEMDFHIGRLMTFLKEADLLDNTLVIFMSDNGPWWDSSNFGAMTKAEWLERNPSKMNGNKGQSWQNGVKSPLFISFTKHFSPSMVNRFVNVQDIVPTLLDITNTEVPAGNKPIDGVSFYSYLKGDVSSEQQRSIYLGSHDVISTKKNFNQWTPFDIEARAGLSVDLQPTAFRNDRYKLLLNHGPEDETYPMPVDNYMLFDMQNDPLERVNIIAQHPVLANEMKAQLSEQFDSFKTDKESFKTPIYEINEDNGVSVVNGFGPVSTEGNTISKAHTLSNMKVMGDSATYNIDVQSSTCFNIYIKLRDTNAVGFKAKIDIQDTSTTFMINENMTQLIGKQILKKGPATLTFSIIENLSKKTWSQVSGLRRFLFIPCDSELKPKNIHLPN